MSFGGPYQGGIYQVMVQEPGREHEALTIRGNLRVEEVVDRRVVCFTVPNETLVTRREGRVAMHGGMASAAVSAVTCAEVTGRF
ncbi:MULTISPECIES: hypothetical protein [Saccharothrix]|uniref:hypothetical protein n=1 Tax=Saccharothrix TaxID=2071 RepID=UPI000939589A|nr:hypothetical protein [Saccharothrix sp. CB00851]OKI23954.1 hypothetical protein A6A25_34845 [Saccharothrix sp. CB00851]